MFESKKASLAIVAIVASSCAMAGPATHSVRASRQQTPSKGGGYYVPYATGPTGAKAPIMNIPGSVTVIPRQALDDQRATSLDRALRNAAGVQ